MIGPVAAIRERLVRRLAEAAPARIQLLTGPRQVGKTTLLLDLAKEFGDAALYAAGDDPTASLPGAWERVWQQAHARPATGPGVLLLDEVQRWPDWASRLKGEWDRVRRDRRPLHVIASGSSAIRLEPGDLRPPSDLRPRTASKGDGGRRGDGGRDLAGRFERLTLSHWPAADIARVFGVSALEAAHAVVRFGGYPGAFQYIPDQARWAAYVRDAIIEPALGRDVLDLADVRKPALLRQVFAVAAIAPAQIVSLQKIQGLLQDRGALETVSYYLSLLGAAQLVAAIDRYTTQKRRQRRAPPKLIVLNNALASAVHPDGAPDRGREPGRFGVWVENACIAHAITGGQRVHYWREEPFEVDAVMEGEWGAWAVEIKTGRFTTVDLRGLAEFTRRHPAFAPLVLTEPGHEQDAASAGFSAISWEQFLLSGPPKGRRV